MAHILLVNDEADLVEICEMVLEDVGYDVDALTDGNAAFDLARRTRPDLIVLDWIMRQSSGDQVLRQLRTEPATAKIPVLMISASHDGEIMARAFGADGFLRKPFNADQLIRSVQRLLPFEHSDPSNRRGS